MSRILKDKQSTAFSSYCLRSNSKGVSHISDPPTVWHVHGPWHVRNCYGVGILRVHDGGASVWLVWKPYACEVGCGVWSKGEPETSFLLEAEEGKFLNVEAPQEAKILKNCYSVINQWSNAASPRKPIVINGNENKAKAFFKWDFRPSNIPALNVRS
ncbi:unnamed protein product [Sphenostylis stenocarpa]|uniref:Uncharacterized protein n=1 Tax=Sphenostylis stenocarpa TaxID=92480 RepID=A0AA86SDD1_9FABA|nr:unnamed protein product [Sphenostylis stenocarpa]